MKHDTKLVTAGRKPGEAFGFVNTPVYRGSTVLHVSRDQLETRTGRYAYGLTGSPTIDALRDAMMELEGGAGCAVVNSGLAAVSLAILSTVSAGDHLLMVDSVYGPTRRFCDTTLKRLGVTTTYYDPLIGAGIAELMRPQTAAVFTESPGSLTFEMQDVPAIADAAHAAGALVLMDNTWAGPTGFPALAKGVDLSIQATTKYVAGHSDVLLGTVVANDRAWPRLQETQHALGLGAGPDDIWLALRGLRTMGLRLRHQWGSGLKVAEWLMAQKPVARVLHPAMAHDRGHALFRRDFAFGSGLFAIELHDVPQAAVDSFLDGLALFGQGWSWGGFESLIVQARPHRSVRKWTGGPLIRLSVGLEDPDDLIGDLADGLKRMEAAR